MRGPYIAIPLSLFLHTGIFPNRLVRPGIGLHRLAVCEINTSSNLM